MYQILQSSKEADVLRLRQALSVSWLLDTF